MHQTLSRIDYILASPACFSEITNVEIKSCELSDHSVVLAHLSLLGAPPRPSRWQFNTSLLKNEEFSVFFRNSLTTFIDLNAGSVDDPRILWDAIKGSIRDSSISFSSHLKKNRLLKIKELEETLTELEAKWQHTLNDALLGRITVIRTELNSLLRQRAEFLMHRTRGTYYFNGSRPSHLLALGLKQNEKFSNTSIIKSPLRTSTEPGEINAEFKTFYSNLYTSEVILDPDILKNFFHDLDLPSLTEEESESLNTPISLEELRKALVNMKRGKSPGWDGIPPELYLAFWDILGSPLFDMINAVINKGAFTAGTNTAVITVLPKPNKDPSLCSNYRPLSPLNGDVHLYAKVLATCLEMYLAKLIHNSQTGFITVFLNC